MCGAPPSRATRERSEQAMLWGSAQGSAKGFGTRRFQVFIEQGKKSCSLIR